MAQGDSRTTAATTLLRYAPIVDEGYYWRLDKLFSNLPALTLDQQAEARLKELVNGEAWLRGPPQWPTRSCGPR